MFPKAKWRSTPFIFYLIFRFQTFPDHRSHDSHISFQVFLLAWLFPAHLHLPVSWESGDLTQKPKNTEKEWLRFQPITVIQITVTISPLPVWIQVWCNFRKLWRGCSKSNPQIVGQSHLALDTVTSWRSSRNQKPWPCGVSSANGLTDSDTRMPLGDS